METFNDIPIIPFEDDTSWEEWLAANYTLTTGIWIKVAKKNSGIDSIDHPGALDVALCYGWIDGQRRSFDDNYFLQKFTPRRKRSLWSKVNIAKVEGLIAKGQMQQPGMLEIDAAKADGRWAAAYESQKNATIPSDLAELFEQYPKAKVFFASLTKANQYAVLWRLMTAKTPAMRASRLEKMVSMLEAGEIVH